MTKCSNTGVPVRFCTCAACGEAAPEAALYIAPHSCKWTADGDIWVTECLHTFEFTSDGPTENKAKFCQYCGGNLIEVQLQVDWKPEAPV